MKRGSGSAQMFLKYPQRSVGPHTGLADTQHANNIVVIIRRWVFIIMLFPSFIHNCEWHLVVVRSLCQKHSNIFFVCSKDTRRKRTFIVRRVEGGDFRIVATWIFFAGRRNIKLCTVFTNNLFFLSIHCKFSKTHLPPTSTRAISLSIIYWFLEIPPLLRVMHRLNWMDNKVSMP